MLKTQLRLGQNQVILLHYHRISALKGVDNSSVHLNGVQRQQIRYYRNEYLKQYYPTLRIGQHHAGKPMSLNSAEVQFNHSHSQQYYALVHSIDVVDIGVDIEDYGRVANMQAFAQRNFHADEYRMWQKTDFCSLFWLKIWTVKEAVLKAHGLGIRLQLSSLNTQAHPTWDFGVVEHELLGQFFYQCLGLPEAIVTVAYRKGQWQKLMVSN